LHLYLCIMPLLPLHATILLRHKNEASPRQDFSRRKNCDRD
jgi:hypothetical protein